MNNANKKSLFLFKTIFVFLVTSLTLLCSSYASPAMSCKQLVSTQIQLAPRPEHLERLKEIMNDPRLSYLIGSKEGRSGSNAIRIYDFIVSKILTLTSDDFNVLYLSTPDRFEDSSRGFWMENAIIEPINGYWTHHVVLEYKGYIIDLEYALERGPILAKTYFEERFQAHRLNRPELVTNEEIYVYRLRGEDYLHELDYMMDLDFSQRRVLGLAGSPEPLSSFLN